MTNTTLKKTMFGNKKMALVFLAVLAACLFFVLFAGSDTMQAATSTNTAKESASAEKKLTILSEMETEADEKTVTIGEDDLKSELGVSAGQAALAKVNKTYAEKLLDQFGYIETEEEDIYETEYPFSRIVVDGAVTDSAASYAMTDSEITFLQYDSPEEAALAAADFEEDGYEALPDVELEVDDCAATSEVSDEFSSAYETADMNLETYQDSGTDEVTVAVIDSGANIDVLNAYFDGRCLEGYNVSSVYEDNSTDIVTYYQDGYKRVSSVNKEDTDDVTDNRGHGTMVASVILAHTGSSVKVVPIKIWNNPSDKNETITLVQWEAALITARDIAEADVVNMSIVTRTLSDDIWCTKDNGENVYCLESNTAEKYNNLLGSVLQGLIDSGCTVVASAGNDYGQNAAYNFPACYEGCWTISAIDSSYNITNFSSIGDAVDFCAPGKKITVINADGDLTTASGTSFSAPLVAACAAQLTSTGGKYDADYYSEGNMKKADSARYTYFQNNCLDLGLQDNADYEGCDFYYGFGLVTMTKYNLENAAVSLSQDSYTYTGSSKKPTVTVSFGDLDLSKYIHYSVSYSNYTNIGTATVTVSGLTSCTGSQTVSYTINPEAPVISSLTSTASKKAKITYTQSNQGGGAYIIYYRKAGSSSWSCASTSNKSYTFTKLTSGATYEFRVRAYKTVSGTIYYSDYSSTETVTVI